MKNKELYVFFSTFCYPFFLQDPGKTFRKVRPSTSDGKPIFICDDNGHLYKQYRTRSMERTAFNKTAETGTASFAFTALGFV